MAFTGDPVSGAEQVFSIGHSALPYEQFRDLLARAGVSAVADVRSAPYSRHLPHFNRESLCDRLRAEGLAYVFMGLELGGRPSHAGFLTDGIADYEKMATAPSFSDSLDRIAAGAARHRIALMCSEQEPLDCHRCLLVGRALVRRGVPVRHILQDGRQTTQQQVEQTLLAMTGRAAGDLFATPAERLALAYRDRARKVAFAAA